jgi:hypothetical protein
MNFNRMKNDSLRYQSGIANIPFGLQVEKWYQQFSSFALQVEK